MLGHRKALRHFSSGRNAQSEMSHRKAQWHFSSGRSAQSEMWQILDWLEGPRCVKKLGLWGSQTLGHPDASGVTEDQRTEKGASRPGNSV